MFCLRAAGKAGNWHCRGILLPRSIVRYTSSETPDSIRSETTETVRSEKVEKASTEATTSTTVEPILIKPGPPRLIKPGPARLTKPEPPLLIKPGPPVPTFEGERSHRYAHLRKDLEELRFDRIKIYFQNTRMYIKCGDGRRNMARLNAFWLRDNCQCEKCVNKLTMQKNHDTFKIPENVWPRATRLNRHGLEIMWSDDHTSNHSITWLEHALGLKDQPIVQALKRPRYFNAYSMRTPPEVVFGDVMEGSRAAMRKLTKNIRERGFCFVVSAPPKPETTERFLKRLGPIRNTHYGGFYDFTPNMALADTAYTNIALPAHTDTTYFTEPAGLQAFHMISHTPPPGSEYPDTHDLGGESLLVDGFRAAATMKEKYPKEYETLCSVPIPWHASGNKNISITPFTRFPVIETSTGGSKGWVRRIRWNNDDRGAVPGGVNSGTAAKWYKAARIWHSIITDRSNEMWYKLDPTRIIVFDNWRVLHGRKAFKGIRRICGGYINRDDFDSRWKMSNWPREEVLTHNYFLELYEGQREMGIFRPKPDNDETEPEPEDSSEVQQLATSEETQAATSDNTEQHSAKENLNVTGLETDFILNSLAEGQTSGQADEVGVPNQTKSVDEKSLDEENGTTYEMGQSVEEGKQK